MFMNAPFWWVVGCTIMFLSIIILPAVINPKKEQRFLKENSEYKAKGKHTAILFVEKEPDDRLRLLWNGVSFLVKYYIRVAKPYKIHFDCSEQKFRSLLRDSNVMSIYIFGHGTRYGLRFGEKLSEYSSMSGTAKVFVGQFHCNGFWLKKFYVPYFGNKQSLAEVLSAERSNVTRWMRLSFLNYWHFWLVHRGLKKEY